MERETKVDELVEKINDTRDKVKLANIIEDNKYHFEIEDNKYRVRLPNSKERLLVEEARGVKMFELLSKPDQYKKKSAWVQIHKASDGTDIVEMELQIEDLQEQINKLRMEMFSKPGANKDRLEKQIADIMLSQKIGRAHV